MNGKRFLIVALVWFLLTLFVDQTFSFWIEFIYDVPCCGGVIEGFPLASTFLWLLRDSFRQASMFLVFSIALWWSQRK